MKKNGKVLTFEGGRENEGKLNIFSGKWRNSASIMK
jgi:hypothetical protein